jgi:hypothetical protein
MTYLGRARPENSLERMALAQMLNGSGRYGANCDSRQHAEHTNRSPSNLLHTESDSAGERARRITSPRSLCF